MFIMIFIRVTALSNYITARKAEISPDMPDAYEYSKTNARIIGIILIVGVVNEIIFTKVRSFYWVAVGIYGLASIILTLLVSNNQQEKLSKKREDLIQVYSILQPLIDKKGSVETFNPSEAKFRLEYLNGVVNKVTIPLDINSFNEELAMNCILLFNKYLNYSDWILKPRYEDRECDFIGTPKPPKLAKYAGSWLRPLEFIPIGVCGTGETGWTVFNCNKKIGRSLFKYEDGTVPDITQIPIGPHLVCAGVTGSGKAIWIDQEIDDER